VPRLVEERAEAVVVEEGETAETCGAATSTSCPSRVISHRR
jgi:hypothetical protein